MPGCEVVDLVSALEEKGFALNSSMMTQYQDKRPEGAAYQEIADLFTLGNVYVGSGAEKKAYNAMGLFSEKDVSAFASDIELNEASKEFKTAIVTIGRPGSEAMSYLPGEEGRFAPDYIGNDNDSLGLSNPELALLSYAKENYDKVIVLINSAIAMDLAELDSYADAIVWIGCPNDYGFRGVADVLNGTVSPSGHLTDTWAVKASRSPAMVNYGLQVFTDADTTAESTMAASNFSYQAEMESIYLGYKYYESRYYDSMFGLNHASEATPEQTAKGVNIWNYADEVVWSFGEGYSYTSFSEELVSSEFIPAVEDGTLKGSVRAEIKVENIGNYPAKHVVQLYMQSPYTPGGIEKSAILLVGYAKTGTLDPGESETVAIETGTNYLVSWDMTKGHYVLEAGSYWFSTGNGAHDALNNIINAQDSGKAAGTYGIVFSKQINELNVTHSPAGEIYENQLHMAIEDYGVTGYGYLTRSDWCSSWPKTIVMARTQSMMDAGPGNMTYEISKSDDTSQILWGQNSGYRYTDMKPALRMTLSITLQ